MKKFILLISMAFVALAIQAQTVTLAPLLENKQLFENGDNVTLTNNVVRTYVLPAFKGVPTTQDFYINLDSLAGNHTNVAVALYGAKFADTAYSQIGSTVNWKGTRVDTTIVISNATANRYNYYKWIITGTGTGTTTIDLTKLLIYK